MNGPFLISFFYLDVRDLRKHWYSSVFCQDRSLSLNLSPVCPKIGSSVALVQKREGGSRTYLPSTLMILTSLVDFWSSLVCVRFLLTYSPLFPDLKGFLVASVTWSTPDGWSTKEVTLISLGDNPISVIQVQRKERWLRLGLTISVIPTDLLVSFMMRGFWIIESYKWRYFFAMYDCTLKSVKSFRNYNFRTDVIRPRFSLIRKFFCVKNNLL